MNAAVTNHLISASYLVASVLFILCLRGLSSPESARRGIRLGELGMFIAVVGTLISTRIVDYKWIIAGMILGSGIGTAISLRIPMTKMPERIAFSHAFGGLATALVGVSEFYDKAGIFESRFTMVAIDFDCFFAFLTFTGSLMAFGKLQGLISGAPITWKFQNVMNIGAFFGALGVLVYLVAFPVAPAWLYYAMCPTVRSLGVLA